MDLRDLRAVFHVDRVPQEELRIVLLDHFTQATSDKSSDAIIYTREQEAALTLRYSKKGEIAAIERGPAFLNSDAEDLRLAIEGSILTRGVRQVRRDIFFASIPVQGAWRFRDHFQILPAPDDAPRPPWVVGDHPFVLEAPFEASANSAIAIERARRSVDEVALILSGLLPAVSATRPNARQLWGVSLEEGDQVERSRWIQETYTFQGFEHVADDFSAPDAPVLERVADAEFYDPVHSIPGGDDRTLDLPVTIDELLESFYGLDVKRRPRFLRWAYWLNISRQSSRSSTSLAYMAIIQAIESLQAQTANPRCGCCDQELPPGPTRKFSEFLERHVPLQDGETEKARKKLYALRSALTHGRTILEADQGLAFGAFHPSWVEEADALRYAAQLARLVGRSWLLAGEAERRA